MKFIVQGGKPLRGEIKIFGAKNAATKALIASLLTDEECVFENFPNIGDVEITMELCRHVGSEIKVDGHVVSIKTPKIKNTTVSKLSRRNRIPILALGPLLAREGKAEVPALGGDKIGHRPVDIHLKALEALGAEISDTGDSFVAKTDGLHGAMIELRFPSIGATENTILAAVTAEGETTIRNAAVEPEIINLIELLQKMGAIIEIDDKRLIVIEGVKKLKGARHRIIPDRNEAVSLACLALATDGNILVKEAEQEHLIAFLNTIKRLGGGYEIEKNGIRFYRKGNLRGTDIKTDTHPGFMTDWQQPLVVVLTEADGRSTVHETIYEDRFGYAEDLNLMGARIKIGTECPAEPCRFGSKNLFHIAVIEGPEKLYGAKLKVRDLRAGMAHLIAALAASGESVIDGVEEIDRGYERIDERLRMLGAEIVRKD